MLQRCATYCAAIVIPFLAGRFSAGEPDFVHSSPIPGSPSRPEQVDDPAVSQQRGSGIPSQARPRNRSSAPRLELADLPEQERGELFDRAIDACFKNLGPLLEYEREHREVIAVSERGSSLISKIPRAPDALYDSVLSAGLDIFGEHGEFSLQSLDVILRTLQRKVEVRSGDHYIITHANIDGGHYTLSGHYADEPIRFEVQTNDNGGVSITQSGATPTASYSKFTSDPIVQRRFAHLFVIAGEDQ